MRVPQLRRSSAAHRLSCSAHRSSSTAPPPSTSTSLSFSFSFLFSLFLLLTSFAPANEPLRQAYLRACSDWESKAVCTAFERTAVEQLRANPASAVAKGYRATAGLMMCQFLSMPWDQYREFVKWRDVLDAAVAAAPKDADLRVLRYGVARNVPVFLGYRGHLEEDRRAMEGALRGGVWAGSPAYEKFVKSTLAAK
ncbi:MAG: hypothetical protein ACO3YQ_08600 [Flavobacteriales bacterium]